MTTVAKMEGAKAPAVKRMTLTEQIAEFLGVTTEVGALVRDFIDEEIGIDWSQSTQSEVNAACREAYAELMGR